MALRGYVMARGDHAWFKKISWQEAEEIAGTRLDRRRQYYTHTEEGLTTNSAYAFNGSRGAEYAQLLTYGEWTENCSGCTETGDYGTQYGPFGCEECGYTGKRRDGIHTPLDWEVQ